MAKSADAFRTISEVAEWLDTPAHVLRFWESKFSQLKPVKRAGGRRYYRPSDMLLLGGIKKLLHIDGMTIKGVQKLLREHGVKHVAAHSQPFDDITQAEATEIGGTSPASKVEPPEEKVVDFRNDALETADSAPDNAEDQMSEAEEVSEAQEDRELDTTDEPAAEVSTGAAKEGQTEPEAEPKDDDPVIMPSFMHRAPEPEAEHKPAPPDPVPDTSRLTVPDLPDDPSDDIEAEPGILTRIASLQPPISDAMADRLNAVLARVRQGSDGNGASHDN